MVTGDSFCKVRKVIYDNNDACVAIVSWTDFHLIVLYQLSEIPYLVILFDAVVPHQVYRALDGKLGTC